MPTGQLHAASDASAGAWVAESIGPFASGVRGLVPPVFEAYARILHPARAADASPVRWATVADWSGGTVHAGAEFRPMARGTGHAAGPPPFDAAPSSGVLPSAELDALADILARHTDPSGECLFGIWEGWGWIDWAAAELRAAPRLELPNRSYLVVAGPLHALVEIGWRPQRDPDEDLRREAPSLIWPANRSWFVASEIDLDSTFVGGSLALIDDLLAEPRLEAWLARPLDQVTANSDPINGPP